MHRPRRQFRARSGGRSGASYRPRWTRLALVEAQHIGCICAFQTFDEALIRADSLAVSNSAQREMLHSHRRACFA